MSKEQAEVNAWTRQLERLAQDYIEAGVPRAEAAERATAEICRQIRNSPPIRS